MANTNVPTLPMQSYNKKAKPSSRTPINITLFSSGWLNYRQTVTVPGVTSTNIIHVSAAPESYIDYGNSLVRCVSQAKDSLTFLCSQIPYVNLSVNILIEN